MLHGLRRSYVAGCRCVRCREANAASVRVSRATARLRCDSAPARAHLAQLVALGIGTRQLGTDTGIARSTIVAVLKGTLATLRPSTAAALLAARAVLAHGSTVPATKTWRFVDSLHREGFTRREVAFHLGHTSQQLQLARRRIRVRSALRLHSLYLRLAAA